MVVIASRQCMRHQCFAMSFTLMCRIDADHWQIPMRFLRVVFRHLIERGENLIMARRRNGGPYDLAHFVFVGMDAGRKPQCRSDAFLRAEGAAMNECLAAEGSGESRHGVEKLVRLRPRPTRGWIGGECQHDGRDRGGFIGLRYAAYRWIFQRVLPTRDQVQRYTSTFSAAINASCGMSTLPNWRMRFLPFFCFSRSLRLRVISPP
jgi:hypothetical protein